jgi:choline-sulfatase
MSLGDEVSMKSPARLGRDNRPNILMLFSDQHNARMAGFMGNTIVQTPSLDRLAARGVVFDNAYCSSPLCSPSRQSFMAGLYCHHIDMWNNTAAMPEDTVTWAHMLSLAGYETSLVGKMHFNGYQKMYGFDRRPVLEGSEAGEHFYSWGLRTSHVWTDPLPYSSVNPQTFDPTRALLNAGPDSPERLKIFQKDLEVLDVTCKMLREKATDKDGRPWAICASFVLPHPPLRGRADIVERYRGKGDLPFNIRGEGRDACDQWILHWHGNMQRASEEAIRHGREVYFSLITEFDEYAGRILDCLAEGGLDANTVVFYFSDHGEMAGEHGMWNKVTLLESSIRVPLIVSWPGHYPQGARIDTPVSLVDLYPTFLEIAGVSLPPPLTVDGHSLVPLLEGRPQDFAGSEVFCEFEGEGWNHPRACIRVGEYKYVYNHTADERLYDLEADPYEMTDLATDPRYLSILLQMRARLFRDWDPAGVEKRVLAAQVRRQIARNKHVCKDLGW